MVQVKAHEATFSMYNIRNLLEFCCALKQMDTGLFRVFPAISSNRNRLNNYQSRAVFGDLLVESQLAIRHSAIRIATAYLDRGKDKSIHKLQIT